MLLRQYNSIRTTCMYYKYVIVNQSLIMSKTEARTEEISTVIQKIGSKAIRKSQIILEPLRRLKTFLGV